MRKTVVLAFFACAMAYAGPLSFDSGVIKGHTEVLGDSTIDPMFKKATSHLVMDDSPLSLHGSIEVSVGDFASDNKKRDEHMHETLESSVFPKATYEIKEVIAKSEGSYQLKGVMTLHGVSKPVNFDGKIVSEGNKVHMKLAGMMKMTDFDIKPPKMVFLSVRDQVEVGVDVVLKR